MRNLVLVSRTVGQGGAENIVVNLAKHYKPHFDKVTVISNGGYRVEELKKYGIDHVIIPDLESKRISDIFITTKTIMMAIERKNTIVHTHHRMAAFYARLCLLVKKFQHIYTAHNVFTNKKNLTSFSLKGSDIIAVGKSVKDNLINFFSIEESSIAIVNNTSFIQSGVRDHPTEYMEQLKKNGSVIYTNIGRIEEQKNMMLFCKAVKKLDEIASDIEFVIIGEGNLKRDIEKYIEDHSINNIHVLGFSSNIRKILELSTVICLSSLWEGQPLIPIESISLGKTLVVTPVPGTLEVVTNEYNGFVSESLEGVQDYSDALKKSINSISNHLDMSKNSVIRYEEYFSNEVFFEMHDRIILKSGG